MQQLRAAVTPPSIGLALACALGFLLAACGGTDGGAKTATPAPQPTVSTGDATAKLRAVALTPSDVGAGFMADATQIMTNDDAAKLRPDTETARRQYEDWGQVLTLSVQYAAAASADLLLGGKTARVMSGATMFNTPDGAAASIAFVRGLSPQLVGSYVEFSASGPAKLTDTNVAKDIQFPAKGDESFAWRTTGRATLAEGLVVSYVADTIFMRIGRATANVTTVALNRPPDRAELERLTDVLVWRARASSI